MGVKPGPVDAMVVVKPKPGATSSSGVRSALYKGYSAENLAERIIRGTRQTALMKTGLDLEMDALRDYAKRKNLNLHKCGLVINPDAPWLGASPDGLVYDPYERPPFGLVEMKCPNAQSYIDCSYITVIHGMHKLKESHSYYSQVQGQLLITGMEWCDFVVCANDDMFVQRIYRDTPVLNILRHICDLSMCR
uniref:YqaJ viral recombinase domain-containing protein n=1 Tax=Nothobranchius kadleci TaxID=1051664 RepID=A0A1A8DH79_NOTKA